MLPLMLLSLASNPESEGRRRVSAPDTESRSISEGQELVLISILPLVVSISIFSGASRESDTFPDTVFTSTLLILPTAAPSTFPDITSIERDSAALIPEKPMLTDTVLKSNSSANI